MDPSGLPLLFAFLFGALFISFLCSVLEAVLLTTPMSYITMLEQEGKQGAKLLKKYKQDIDKPISAILSLNTIAHTVGAAGVGAQSDAVFGHEWFAVTSGVLTFLILAFSEILPKSVGCAYWRSLAIPCSKIIHALVIITYPLVLFSELITFLVSGHKKSVSVSREEVSAMVTVGAEEGVLETKENRMIQNLLKLDDIKARDIMTPSPVVEMAEESMTLREFYCNEEYRNFSRIPVYNEENDDYINGYVLRQTILEMLAEDKFDMRLSEIMRPVLTFEESTDVSTIWEKLLAKKEHLSVIVDEYGSFRGLVTMEDVIETMLGTEIVDEKDTVTDMQEFAREKWQEQKKEQEEQQAEDEAEAEAKAEAKAEDATPQTAVQSQVEAKPETGTAAQATAASAAATTHAPVAATAPATAAALATATAAPAAAKADNAANAQSATSAEAVAGKAESAPAPKADAQPTAHPAAQPTAAPAGKSEAKPDAATKG